MIFGFTKGDIREELRQLWHIAWPLFIAQMAQMGTGVVDTMMAGHYSAQDLAAIAVGYNIWLPLYLLALGVLFIVATLVAQDFGAARFNDIRKLFPQSLWLGLLLGVFIAPFCYYSEPVIELLGLSSAAQAKTVSYVQMVAWGLPAIGLFQALRFHTQGLGITKPFAVASVLGFIANIPLNYAFIYGGFGAPELGAQGCGIATAMSMWLSLLIIALYMTWQQSWRKFMPGKLFATPDFALIKTILTLGLPVGLTFFLEVGVFSLIALLVGTLGETAMASHQIAFNIWDMFYIPMLAIGTAMSTRIGHAIGAENPLLIRRALLVASGVGASIALITTSILVTIPHSIIALYSDSEDIRTMATGLIRLAAFFIVIDAIQIIGSFTLRAFKETQYPFLAMVVSYWLIALPLGVWLGLYQAETPGEGAAGFWYATIAGIAVCALLVMLRVKKLLRTR